MACNHMQKVCKEIIIFSMWKTSKLTYWILEYWRFSLDFEQNSDYQFSAFIVNMKDVESNLKSYS